jgi:exonuclease VII small subunit
MTPPEAVGDAIPVADLSYTEASRELDAIVEFFEQREVDVDQLVVRLERATAIVDELDRRVRKTRAQVEELVPRLEAVSRGESDGGDVGAEDLGSEGADADLGEEDDEDLAEEDAVVAGGLANIGDDPAGEDADGDEQALF